MLINNKKSLAGILARRNIEVNDYAIQDSYHHTTIDPSQQYDSGQQQQIACDDM